MKNKNEFSNLIHETEKLVSAGLLVVDSIKRQLILVESFWKKMDKAGQDNFIKNMAVYCKLENAYDGILEDDYAELLLMIKADDQSINYFYRLGDNKIEKVDL